MKRFLLSLTVGLSASFAVHAQGQTPAKPNIIFVLADDLGLDGVSAYGADKHRTPNIDALAASGIRFETAYAAPLCGPSRCLLMTGRYAFRTGGITNQSWRPDGPGAKSSDEVPIAKLLKSAGYATGQSGKWRQVGELPSDWGFDEFLTDNTAAGWYWQTKYNKNGTIENLPEGTYGPNVVEKFAFDFIERHKDGPFFLYYATHLVHGPILKTPDTDKNTTDSDALYDENIKYMDKQVGNLVAELEKLNLRKNTLILFAGDNGTAAGRPSPVHGRMINGAKGSMLEGGSHIPFIASWPGTTPAGKTVSHLISFADPYATFAEIAGAKPPEHFTIDGTSFAAELRGETPKPRDVAYVQLGEHWFVRDSGFKLNEKGELFDLSDAPFVEKLIPTENDTDATKAERQKLAAALATLDPAAGKRDEDGGLRRNRVAAASTTEPSTPSAGPWKNGDSLTGPEAPKVGGSKVEVSAEIDATGKDGVIVSQGGAANGYALFIKDGKLTFAVRETRELTSIAAKDPLGSGHFKITATIGEAGALAISVDGKSVATGKAAGYIPQQPKAGFFVGTSGGSAVADYPAGLRFDATITNVRVKALPG